MPRCEDYPCCGHDRCPGRDENGEEIWTCTECGCDLPAKARSSICADCQSAIRKEMEAGYDRSERDDDLKGQFEVMAEAADRYNEVVPLLNKGKKS